MSEKQFEELVNQVLSLSSSEKKRLIERVTSTLEQPEMVQPKRKRSLLGLCADLGPAPSAEDIDKARREAWANFPREDI